LIDAKIYEAIVKNATDAVIVTDFEGNIISWNQSATSIFGYSEQEVLGKYVHDVLPVYELRERADHAFKRFQNNNAQGPLIGKGIHVKGLTKHGKAIHVHFSPNVIKLNDQTFIYAFIRDITEIIELQEKLRIQSTTDDLTGILNRRAFLENFNKVFTHAQKHSLSLSLMLFDIDHFKMVNDQFGHPAGDLVIKLFAQHIGKLIRSNDIFGRVGGEEFYLALPETSLQEAQKTAEEIRQQIEKLDISFGNRTLKITTSIGLTAIEKDDTFEQIQHRSDIALYKAKDEGRNRICLS